MKNRGKHLLNKNKSKSDVNKDSYGKVELNATKRLLPIGDINEIVNVAERFNKERQTSPYYRINGSINTLFTNILFNTTGENSWTSLMDPKFRDMSYPPDSIDLDQEEDLTYKQAINTHLTEEHGWLGYYDPNVASMNPCAFTDMEPNRNLFSFSPPTNVKNWELSVVYPYESVSGYTTNGGLIITHMIEVEISGRKMTAFGTPIKHNLSQGSQVKISGLNPLDFDGLYTVIRVGLDNGDYKDNYFCLDVDPISFDLGINPRMKRVFNGVESRYYHRKFKRVKMRSTSIMEPDDYEIFPLAFSQNVFNDKIFQFVINEDVDVSNLVDNLGRPISELYVMLLKKPNNGFTNIKSGLDVVNIEGVEDIKDIPDIRRVYNDVINSHNPLETNVLIENNTYFGDIVEYNPYELIEHTLSEVIHRFNTINRETQSYLTDPITDELYDLGVRHEGYMYKPFHKLQIRAFSSYIEQGDHSVIGVPSYAEDLGDGRLLWRDLLDIGFNDIQEKVIDYPFLNGTHYLHKNIMFPLRRQDPFGVYGLYHGTFPRDWRGRPISDNHIIKNSEDVC